MILPPESVSLPHPGKLLLIEPLDYPNPYDFHAPHRHDYFEIILVESGNGHQIIDFSPYNIEGGKLYIIYPGQMHLMRRNTAQGLLIQFRKDLFEVIYPLRHHHFYFPKSEFVLEPKTFKMLYSITENIMGLIQTDQLSSLSVYKAYSYLKIILITLIELHENKTSKKLNTIVSQFLSLLTQHVKSKRKVTDYCSLMNCTPDKLTINCRNSLGKTPLNLIHEELLLEIRRLLLLNELSLKEICYELNFDSQSNFSAFIKNSTGMTPSELQSNILEIYN